MTQIYLGLCYGREGADGCQEDEQQHFHLLLLLFWSVLMPLSSTQPNRQPWEGATSNLLPLMYLTCQRELNLSCVRKSGAQGPISGKAAPHSHFCLNLPTLWLSHLQDTQPIYTSGCEQTSVLAVQHSPFTSALAWLCLVVSLSFIFWAVLKTVMKASNTNMLSFSYRFTNTAYGLHPEVLSR